MFDSSSEFESKRFVKFLLTRLVLRLVCHDKGSVDVQIALKYFFSSVILGLHLKALTSLEVAAVFLADNCGLHNSVFTTV